MPALIEVQPAQPFVALATTSNRAAPRNSARGSIRRPAAMVPNVIGESGRLCPHSFAAITCTGYGRGRGGTVVVVVPSGKGNLSAGPPLAGVTTMTSDSAVA